MLLRNIIAAACTIIVASSLLAGCGPSRKSVKRGSDGYSVSQPAGPKQAPLRPADYTLGVDDPMARALIGNAQGWIGTRYLFGGAQRSGTDCSGLVMTVYSEVTGVKIPRTTREQVRYCTQVARNQMLPGDLVFFAQPVKTDVTDPEMNNDEIYGVSDLGKSAVRPAIERVSHVGLYIGDGRMIHASSSRGVMVSSCDTGYWGDRYVTGARVEAAPRAYASLHGGGRPAPASRQAIPPVTKAALQSEPAPEPPLQAQNSPSVEPVVSTIDLLDMLINDKVDSIMSSQYND